ncbi:MAG: PepSY-like domain-containing protein [Spirochaetaceae bacterium]|nr:PepSY-like domain-containing protein [Spirochaetaceae bacterium]
MKKLFAIGLLATTLLFGASADSSDSTNSLPQAALDFLEASFPGLTVASVESDRNEFEVMLSNNTEVDFDRKGNWEAVKSLISVPANLLPSRATNYLISLYPETNILEIENNANSYEVKLANNWEIVFAKDGSFVSKDWDK